MHGTFSDVQVRVIQKKKLNRSLIIKRAAGCFAAFLFVVLILTVVAVISEVTTDGFGLITYATHTSAEIAAKRVTHAMLKQVVFTRIDATHTMGCPLPSMSQSDLAVWVNYAQRAGWPPYPAGGAFCVDP